MVLYRLFVLAWAFKSVFSIGNNAMGSVSCWQNTCLPCRKFVSQMVWTKNISDEQCNCSSFRENVLVHKVQLLNASSGQCVTPPERWTEFDLIQTGFKGQNIPYYSGPSSVKRPARVYVKAKASCASRAYANYTQGVVRVHEHFGIKVTKEVYYMINGSWVWADHADGDLFNDGRGDPFHEFIFDLRHDETSIYYNYRRLVSTELHAQTKEGGIQLDGATGPWLNFVSVYDDQCEVKCEYWKCDEDGNCACVDIIPTTAPIEEVEDAGLLWVILCIMITNIGCLILFTVFWRCYGRSQRNPDSDRRRSKRLSSFYSARGSSFRRSTRVLEPARDSHHDANESDRRRSKRGSSMYSARGSSFRRSTRHGLGSFSRDSGAAEASVGISLKQSEGRVTRNDRSRVESRQEQKRRKSVDNLIVGQDDRASAEGSPARFTRPKKPESSKPKPAVKPKVPKPKVPKPKKPPRTKKKGKKTRMVEEKKKAKTKKKNSKTKTTKKKNSAVELNHDKQQASRKSKENPSKVGLVHDSRKDSEPKAETAQSFSSTLAPDSKFPSAKNSLVRSSSSSDNMNKEDTFASSNIETISPDPIEVERERVIEKEGSTSAQEIIQEIELTADMKFYE